MPRGKKKFALIWWVGTNQSNVIPLSKIKKKDQKIDCVTELLWIEGKDKQVLKAKVVAIGDDEGALYKIPLNADGIIVDSSTKIFSKEVILSQKEGSNHKKLVEDVKKSNQKRLNAKIISDPPIFPITDPSMRRKQSGEDSYGTMNIEATGATRSFQKKKLKAGDTARLKRSHSTAVGSGVTGSMAGSQKKRVPSVERCKSASYSATTYDPYLHHPNADRIGNRMRMSSLNWGEERRDSPSTAINSRILNSYRDTSPRPPFSQNYNPMMNQNDYWYHQNPQTTQQNNFTMWSGQENSNNSLQSSMPRHPPVHQHHHSHSKYFKTGSENYYPQHTEVNEGMYLPPHPQGNYRMNPCSGQQYSFNLEPALPQKTIVDGNNLDNAQEQHSESERMNSEEILNDATNSTERPVLTVLTTVKNPQSSDNQNYRETSLFSASTASKVLSEGQSLPSNNVDSSSTADPPTSHHGVPAGMRSNDVPIALVRHENSNEISLNQQGREEMGENTLENTLDYSKGENDEHEVRFNEPSGLLGLSPDDWRQQSDNDYSHHGVASTGDETSNAVGETGSATEETDDSDDEAVAVEYEATGAGANSNNAHINLMARAIAPYLPRPAPRGFIDYQRALLLALELNGEEIEGSKLKKKVPHSKPSSEKPEQPLPEHYYKPGEEKEEIAPYSGFYMHKEKLTLAYLMALKEGKFVWKEYVKAILRMVYDDDIANHCAQGKRNSGRPGICQRLYHGLYNKICCIVQQNGDVVKESDYTYLINKSGSNKRPKRGDNS